MALALRLVSSRMAAPLPLGIVAALLMLAPPGVESSCMTEAAADFSNGTISAFTDCLKGNCADFTPEELKAFTGKDEGAAIDCDSELGNYDIPCSTKISDATGGIGDAVELKTVFPAATWAKTWGEFCYKRCHADCAGPPTPATPTPAPADAPASPTPAPTPAPTPIPSCRRLRAAGATSNVTTGRGLANFGCELVQDSQCYDLNVMPGPNLEEDFCTSNEGTKTVEDILETCETFCGVGRIPIPLGVPSFGLGQEDMDSICLGERGQDTGLFGTYDTSIMGICKRGAGALEIIKTRSADVVAAVDLMHLQQLLFRASLKQKVKDLAAEISSEEFKKELMNRLDHEKIGFYKDMVKAKLANILAGGTDTSALIDAMTRISAATTSLFDVLEENLPALEKYSEKCGTPVLAIGENEEYLMDICVQNTNKCFPNEYAQHVGCCCGAMPASLVFDIEADTTGRRLAGSAGAASSRKLSEDTVDVCFEANAANSEKAKKLEDELKLSVEGKALLDEYVARLEEQYPAWSEPCNGRRLKSEVPAEPVVGRQLQSSTPKLTCSPPSGLASTTPEQDESLKVAFSQYTELDFCIDLPSPRSTAEKEEQMSSKDLSDQCEAFCGETAVPMLIGSVEYGFNQSAMEALCIDSELVDTDTSKISQCHQDAEVFLNVDIKMAAFLTGLYELEFAKQQYEVAVADTVPLMKDKIASEGEGVLKDARADLKAEKYIEFLQTKVLQTVTGESEAALMFKNKLKSLKNKFIELKNVTAEAIQRYTDFLDNCGVLFTGKGKNQEFLLDMCSQTSKECIDEAGGWGRHAGCCCGYTPYMAVGKQTKSSKYTIPGLEAAIFAEDTTGLARVARRLDDQSGDVFSICGQAWQAAMPAFVEMYKKTGKSPTFEAWLSKLKGQYPNENFCAFEDPEAFVLGTGGSGGTGGTGGSGNEPMDMASFAVGIGPGTVLLLFLSTLLL